MSIEFLTSGAWFSSQINCLVFLQDIRNSFGPVFDDIFLSITYLGELFFPTLVMCIIYWCFDFRAGVFLFSLNGFGMLSAQILKCLCCIYRPWVLSDKIKPVEAALARAGGYSFPSGHSSMISSSAGGMAFLTWKNKPLFWSLIFIILLVCFSRLYVGVHTPQDVLSGIVVAVILICILNKIINSCEKDNKKYLYLMAGANIIVILILAFILTKSYPNDYVNGKLLVNPAKAKYIAVVYSGWILGILNGIYLCARFFRFNPKNGSLRNKIIRGIIGATVLYIILHYVQIYFFEGEADYKLTMISMFLSGFFITAIYPFIFTKFSSK